MMLGSELETGVELPTSTKSDARHSRVHAEGLLYHVIARDNDGQKTFLGKAIIRLLSRRFGGREPIRNFVCEAMVNVPAA